MLKLAKVKKSFGSKVVFDDISLEIKDSEFFCVLGPSGCGKSTLLRLIAGISQLSGGDIYLDGTRITRVPAQKRDCSFVFQNYALLPHLSVFENVAFPLVALNYANDRNFLRKAGLLFGALEKKVNPEEVHEVYAALALVHLENFGNRRVQTLSGGEAQRVALARALVTRPRVILMDEPLANLDRELKKELRQEIKRIHRQVGLTFIYVTHDQEEALFLADRVAVMRDGVLEQVDAPGALFEAPKNSWVGKFLGIENVWPAQALADVLSVGAQTCFGLWAKDLKLGRDPGGASVAMTKSGYPQSGWTREWLELGRAETMPAKVAEIILVAPGQYKVKLSLLLRGAKYEAWADASKDNLQNLKLSPGAECYCAFDRDRLLRWVD